VGSGGLAAVDDHRVTDRERGFSVDGDVSHHDAGTLAGERDLPSKRSLTA